ncbi:MAG: tRNA-binding protein [Candidatus Kapaibacterium sp.]
MVMITFQQFHDVEMHVGKILTTEQFPEARKPAYKLTIDFGDIIGVKQSSAQITAHYTPEQLPGRLVIAVTNFPPKQIATFMSEVLVLGVNDEHGNVVLLSPDSSVPVGTRVY